MTQINIDQLTEEQQEQIARQYAEKKKNENKKREDDRKAYKDLVNETVPALIGQIKDLSTLLSEVKADIYENFEQLMKLKFDLFDVKDEQQSHSFTTTDGKYTIVIGYNVNDGWDDTVSAGIAKINQYIQSLVGVGNQDTITIINHLLKRDDKGNLKSSRVLELSKLADKLKNKEFKDGVDIIRKAHRPVRSSFFVKAWEVSKTGDKVFFPLSISSVPFPEEFDYTFILPAVGNE